MSDQLHPNVLETCPCQQERLFTNVADLHRDLQTHAEAWLRDDKFIPELLFATRGAGAHIMGGELPPFRSSAELLSRVRPMIAAEGFSCVAFLMPTRRHGPGIIVTDLPNSLILCVVDRSGATEQTCWDVKITRDGTVKQWERLTGQVDGLGFNAGAVFDTQAN